jgi:hypothetical protein
VVSSAFDTGIRASSAPRRERLPTRLRSTGSGVVQQVVVGAVGNHHHPPGRTRRCSCGGPPARDDRRPQRQPGTALNRPVKSAVRPGFGRRVRAPDHRAVVQVDGLRAHPGARCRRRWHQDRVVVGHDAAPRPEPGHDDADTGIAAPVASHRQSRHGCAMRSGRPGYRPSRGNFSSALFCMTG